MNCPHTIILLILLLTLKMDTVISGTCKVISTSNYYSTNECIAEVVCNGPLEDISNHLSEWNFCGERQQRGEYDQYGNYKYLYTFIRQFSILLTLRNIDSPENTFLDIAQLSERIKVLTITNSTLMPQLYKLVHLNNIKVVYNGIQTINLNNFLPLLELHYINASHNSISELDTRLDNEAEVSKKVTIIDLSYNNIEVLPNNCFSHFSQLEHLNISHNILTQLDILTFEGISQLQTLQISHNKLLELGHTLARFINLRELLLDNNCVTLIIEPNFRTMAKLEKMNLSSNKLRDIENKSFQSLISLTQIDLSYNRISFIRKTFFTNNTQLHLLDLSNNVIKSIEPDSFKDKNISEFNIDNNKLSGLLDKDTFAGIHLKSLDLSGFNITELGSEVFRDSHICYLNLSKNFISNISQTAFKSLNSLTILDISHNTLNYMNFDTVDLKELSVLRAQSNNIKNITKNTFKNLTSLTELNLSHNDISEVESKSFQDLSNLKILQLSSNSFIKSIDRHTFVGLTSLSRIELAYTRISTIQEGAFSGIIKHLNLSHGEIINISYNAFKNLSSIEVIDASHNLLKNFTVNTTSISLIKELYINNNKITNVNDNMFSGLIYLQVLNLANNNIVVIESEAFRTIVSLNKLDLSSNVDLEIDGNLFGNLTSLSVVSLNGNKRPFNFEHVSNTSIEQLYLSTCNIENLNPIFIFKIINLSNLDLSRNKISFIDKLSFQKIPSLVWLDLSFNSISFIQPGTFLKTNSIKMLNLYDNEFTDIQFGVLDGLKHLQTLNVSNNVLHSFDVNLLHNIPQISTIALDDNVIDYFKFRDFSNTSLREITIGGNPIPCHVFADLKRNNFDAFRVTAEKLDYHSENVDGITCRSNFNKNLSLTQMNANDINATYAFIALGSAIENLRTSIDKLNSKQVSNDKDIVLKDLHHALQSIIVDSHRSQNVTNINLDRLADIMKELTNISYKINSRLLYIDEFNKNQSKFRIDSQKSFSYYNNESMLLEYQLKSYMNMLNEEKDKMITELKTLNQDLKNENNNESRTGERNGNNSIEVLLYIIVVCLSMMTVVFVWKYVCSLRRRLTRGIGLHSSTQPIANVIEMQ